VTRKEAAPLTYSVARKKGKKGVMKRPGKGTGGPRTKGNGIEADM